MKIAQAVGVVIGVALMAAPAVWHYADEPAADLHRVVGPVAAGLAFIAMWKVVVGVRWPNALLGALLIVAPLFVGHPAAAVAVGVVAGAALVIATPFGGPSGDRFGGGWRSVWDRQRRRATEGRQA